MKLYTVNVKLNGTTILTAGSATPIALTVVASLLHAPSSTSFGPGLSASEAGLPVSFTVVACDDFDNVRGGDRSREPRHWLSHAERNQTS